MWSLIKTCLICHVACLFININAREINTVQRIFNFTPGQLIKYANKIAREDNSFLYAGCKSDALDPEINCYVNLETYTSNYSCKFHATRTSGLLVQNPYLQLNIQYFGEEKAILYWRQQLKSRVSNDPNEKIFISVLNMVSCEYKTFSHVYAIEPKEEGVCGSPIVFRDSFDLIFSNKTVCHSNRTCRISYDEEGNQVGDPAPFLTKTTEIFAQPFSPSPLKIFMVVGRNPASRNQSLDLIYPTGARRNLATYNFESMWESSMSHGIFGFCIIQNGEADSLECSRFDRNGNQLMNISIPHSKQTKIALHNLAKDGMLLVNGSMVNDTWSEFRVERLYPDGKRDLKMTIDGLEMKCEDVESLKVEVYEKGSDKICFYFACDYPAVDRRIGYVRKCTSKADVVL